MASRLGTGGVSSHGGKGLFGVRQASEYLGLTRRALYNLVSARRIPVVRIGRRVRFDIRDLDRMIEENRVGSRT